MSANKFLPFVTQNSTPLHIFTSLVSRSKGHEWAEILSILLAIYGLGIERVKAYVSELPSMTKEELFNNLAHQYGSYRPDSDVIELFMGLRQVFANKELSDEERAFLDLDESDELDVQERLFYILALLLSDNGEHINSDYDFAGVLENRESSLENIQLHVKFSDNGEPKVFTSKSQLENFIRYNVGLPSHLKHQVTYKAILLTDSPE